MDSGRCACFHASQFKPEVFERNRNVIHRRFAPASFVDHFLPDHHSSAHKGACGEHNGFPGQLFTATQDDSFKVAVFSPDLGGGCFENFEVFLLLNDGLHTGRVEGFVALRPMRLNCRAFAGVDRAKLDRGKICIARLFAA